MTNCINTYKLHIGRRRNKRGRCRITHLIHGHLTTLFLTLEIKGGCLDFLKPKEEEEEEEEEKEEDVE